MPVMVEPFAGIVEGGFVGGALALVGGGVWGGNGKEGKQRSIDRTLDDVESLIPYMPASVLVLINRSSRMSKDSWCLAGAC